MYDPVAAFDTGSSAEYMQNKDPKIILPRGCQNFPSIPELARWLRIQNGVVLESHHGSVTEIFFRKIQLLALFRLVYPLYKNITPTGQVAVPRKSPEYSASPNFWTTKEPLGYFRGKN